ncbi:MAG TPA: YkvA family protein [Cystobacter sp.]
MNVAGLRVMGTRFFRYVRDPRVPRWRRLMGLFAVAYFLFPLDVVPDFLPLLGWLDDLGVLSGVAWFMARELERYRPEPMGWPTPVDVPRTGTPPLGQR